MKNYYKRIIAILILCVALVISSTSAFAWYSFVYKEEVSVEGSSENGYFHGGTGTEAQPYLISTVRHMYNFAWLQNTGRFDSKTYYFELCDTSDEQDGKLSMILENTKIIIPPIGNDEHPFNGVFDGKGFKIENLIVSTDVNVIYNGDQLPEGYKFSNSVGFFGKTGESSIIRNFILDNPVVDVYSTETDYSASNDTDKTVGLAIGHVGYQAHSIGVIGGSLGVHRTGYKTYNSIIGSIASGINVDITGGGSSGSSSGEDTGFFIPDDIFNKFPSTAKNIGTKSENKLTLSPKMWLVEDKENPSFGLGSFSFTTGANTTTIEAGKVTEFYYLGENAKTNTGAYSNGLDSGVPFYQKGDTDSTLVKMDSTNTGDALTIREKIKNANGVLDSLNYFLNWENSPNNADFSKNTQPSQTFNVVSEGDKLLEGNGYYNIYTNSIKVRISSSSTKIFILASNTGSNPRYVGVYKVSNGYGSYEDFKYGTGGLSEKDALEKLSKKTPLQALELPAKGPVVGCEFKLDGTGEGTYMLSSTNSSIRIHYLAVEGVDEGDISSGQVGTDNNIGVSAIDFVYPDVSISQTEGTNITINGETVDSKYNFVVNKGQSAIEFYQKTSTSVYFELVTTTMALYFKREVTDTATFVVQYYNQAPLASYPDLVTIISGGPDLTIGPAGVTSSGPTF